MCKKLIYLISFVLVLAVASDASADLVGHWKLDEGSGTTVVDSSGNGNDGTIVNNPTWIPGVNKRALVFHGLGSSGGGGDYIDCGNDASLDITGPISITLWIRPGADDPEGKATTTAPMAKAMAGMSPSWSFQVRYGWGQGAPTPYMSFTFPPAGGTPRAWAHVGRKLERFEWCHIACSFDGSTLRCFLNGEETNSTPMGGTTSSQTPVLIGSDGWGCDWIGAIDEVRMYNHALTVEEIQQAMLIVPPGAASEPNPADEATDVPLEAVLSWTPGKYAPPVNGHKVYLSESFNDVNDGVGGIAADANSYDPEHLDWGTTYYWRVDEVNGPPDHTVHPGSVWSFTTEPFGYAIENITVTASSSAVAKEPENTINGSGLDESGLLHGKDGDDAMWLSDIAGPQPTWIQYEFDKVYKMHELWVWNSNEFLEPMVGFGFKDVTIEYSVNGADYTTLGTTHEFARAPGTPDYAHNTTVDLGGVGAKYVRLTANNNWGGILNQYGLSEVRFLYVPVQAAEPRPADGETDVSIGTIDKPIDVTLGFRAGREAAKHDVYFSSDEQAVIDGTAAVTTLTETSHGPLSLDLGKTYYWRVDEVNEAEIPAMWQGAVWDFTTQEYFVVDDFESYNDLDPTDPNSNRIFNAWIDGYEQPTNGSLVGYENPPFAEQSVVHGDKQSMPLAYDNSGTATYSEATLTLTSGRDWTIRGAEALSLWFKGNAPGFLEEPAGTFTVNASGTDIWGTADEFRYVWKQLSGDGEIIAQVLSVQQTDNWAKAGVMIRDTLDADSTNAMAYITDSGRVGWQYRAVAAGTSTSTRSDQGVVTAPHWVKLSRQGNIITAQHSSDGVTWEDMVETANPQEPSFKNIVMNPNAYIGLALTSHVAGVTCKAVFSDVTTTGAVSGVFTEQAIGADMPANGPASMYVAVANSGGTPAAVYHDDPSAAQTGDWTEWSINLKAFADQGVVLTNINTISIGFGDKNNPQPGGSGLVYFDDIRLYPLP